VRGPGIPLYLAGARLIGNYPVGPLAGVAFNLTLLSHDGNLDMGLHIDTAAITEPELLRTCMEESFAKILAVLVAVGDGGDHGLSGQQQPYV